MDFSKRNLTIAAVVVVIIAAIVIFSKTRPKQDMTPSETQADQPVNTPTPQPTSSAASSTWEGTLKISDDLKKGNLMLVMKDRTLYLYTSRDFSSLLNKQVTVTYEGTTDSFTLDDIVAK